MRAAVQAHVLQLHQHRHPDHQLLPVQLRQSGRQLLFLSPIQDSSKQKKVRIRDKLFFIFHSILNIKYIFKQIVGNSSETRINEKKSS